MFWEAELLPLLAVLLAVLPGVLLRPICAEPDKCPAPPLLGAGFEDGRADDGLPHVLVCPLGLEPVAVTASCPYAAAEFRRPYC